MRRFFSKEDQRNQDWIALPKAEKINVRKHEREEWESDGKGEKKNDSARKSARKNHAIPLSLSFPSSCLCTLHSYITVPFSLPHSLLFHSFSSFSFLLLFPQKQVLSLPFSLFLPLSPHFLSIVTFSFPRSLVPSHSLWYNNYSYSFAAAEVEI